MQKSNQLNNQITNQNENFAKVVRDRHIEKSNFENEKTNLNIKIKVKEEEVAQYKKLLEEIKEKSL